MSVLLATLVTDSTCMGERSPRVAPTGQAETTRTNVLETGASAAP
jgi:hypothetical protein